MSEFYSIVTNTGFQKVNECLVDGTKLDLKFIAVGDSNGSYYEPAIEQTSLVNECWRGEISEINEDNLGLFARSLIPFNIGGFYIREIGVFDTENNLLIVGKQAETYKPIVSEGTCKDIWLKVILSSINSDVIELKIDPSVQTATVQYVTNLFNSHSHSDLMPILIYDTNANGIVDSCEFVDGGIFTDNQNINIPLPQIIPQLLMSTIIYDQNNDGIVDNAENIDAGEF
ncbi:MAG: tail fiber-like protein [Candidatus Peregrinibacteria bacterium GW2011_GWC2_33_13]|nr:MAG: tail fiber-like protein [Candidatus Peregrinibacteria bacterium GW2011_GWC2_33_13]